jgi:hypothetical protein
MFTPKILTLSYDFVEPSKYCLEVERTVEGYLQKLRREKTRLSPREHSSTRKKTHYSTKHTRTTFIDYDCVPGDSVIMYRFCL